MKQVLGITTIDRTEVNPINGTQNYLNECLNALFNPSSEDVDVILFDGGSASLDFITRTEKYAYLSKVVDSDKKLNCFANTNRALKYMDDNYDTEWIFLLQDDVIVQEGVLGRLTELLNRAPRDAGMLTYYTSPQTHDQRLLRSTIEFPLLKKSGYVEYAKNIWYAVPFSAYKKSLIKGWFSSELYKKGENGYSGIDMYLPVWYAGVSKVYGYAPFLAQNIGKVTSIFRLQGA